MDEVEFYMIENPYHLCKEDKPQDIELIKLDNLKAEFIGSDYNFPLSAKLQTLVFTNCLDTDRDVYLRFSEFKQIDYQIQILLNSNGLDQGTAQNGVNELDQHIMHLVYKGFRSTRPQFYNGFYQSLYLMAAMGCFMTAYAVYAFNEDSRQKNLVWSPVGNINIYSVLVPAT